MKVAVVGTGISGMVAARRLHDAGHEVHIFEARDRIGGHTATVNASLDGHDYVVDTGFIVFNERTYPGFCALLNELGVGWKSSDMSFSARVDRDRMEYNGTSTRSLFAQKRNVLRPQFWSMIRGILRFYKEAPALLEQDPDGVGPTLREVLETGGYSRPFIDWHIVPMACAVWSGIPDEILSFPARSLVRFFANHGFLQVEDRPPWLTVEGGSRAYADALLAPVIDKVRLSTPVQSVRPIPGEGKTGTVEVTAAGNTETFDKVLLSCHSDQALHMLEDPTPAETEILGAIRYQPNEVTLHTDPVLMPHRKAAWAAWNVWVPKESGVDKNPVRVTYWMNPLQSIEGPHDLFVSLNSNGAIAPESIIETKTFHHPIFDSPAIEAQGRFEEIDGARGVHYCGAYWSFGFHEDGLQSARRALVRMGVDPKLPDRAEELRPSHAAMGQAAKGPDAGAPRP